MIERKIRKGEVLVSCGRLEKKDGGRKRVLRTPDSFDEVATNARGNWQAINFVQVNRTNDAKIAEKAKKCKQKFSGYFEAHQSLHRSMFDRALGKMSFNRRKKGMSLHKSA